MVQETTLELENVAYAYPDGTQGICELSVQLNKGERIAVLGHNGAGKSTLFLLLNAILKANEGRLLLDKKPLKPSKKELLELRKKVGVVFQEPDTQLFAGSVREELAFGPMNLGWSADEIKVVVEKSIGLLGLEDLAGRPPHALSYGQKKRVAIAAVLSMSPDFLVLDEPNSGLDAVNERIVEQLLERLHSEGKTLIIATHDVDSVWEWADRVLVLHEGKLLFDGLPLEFFAHKAYRATTGIGLPKVLDTYWHMGGRLDASVTPRNQNELKKWLNQFK